MPTPAPKVFLRARRTILCTLAAITLSVAVIASVVLYERHQSSVQKINYSELYKLAETTQSGALIVEGETITVRKADGTTVEATVTGEAAQHEVVELFRKNNVPVEFRALQPGVLVSVLNWVLPLASLLLLGVIG